MGIDHGGSDITMPQQLLDGADIKIGLQQVTGKAMAKGMRRYPLADLCAPHRAPDRLLNMRFMQMVAPIFL